MSDFLHPLFGEDNENTSASNQHTSTGKNPKHVPTTVHHSPCQAVIIHKTLPETSNCVLRSDVTDPLKNLFLHF